MGFVGDRRLQTLRVRKNPGVGRRAKTIRRYRADAIDQLTDAHDRPRTASD